MARPATALKTRHLHTQKIAGTSLTTTVQQLVPRRSRRRRQLLLRMYARTKRHLAYNIEIQNTNTKVVIVVFNTNTNPAARCQSFILLRMSTEKSITYEQESNTYEKESSIYEYESTNTVLLRMISYIVLHTNTRVQ